MGIKAFIPAGQTALTVNGLHQWDYGRKLVIYDDSLPALIEVHFAFGGMKDAIVHSCSVLQGVAEVAIPDQCLEQITPITAYIYEVGESSGATTKVIVLTVTPRPRPQIAGALTPTISDKYTELMGAVNEQVNALKTGNVTVSKALTAEKALTADNATLADTSTTAMEAQEAQYAHASRMLDFDEFDNLRKTISDPGLYLLYMQTPSDELKSEILFVPELGDRIYTSSGGNAYCRSNGSVEPLNEVIIHSVIQIGTYIQAKG